MTNDNELQPVRSEKEMELLDDESLDGVAGGAGDPTYEARWCPRRRGNPHRFQRVHQDFMYNYYRCMDCQAEIKVSATWKSDDGSLPPRILIRPGK